MSRRIVIFLGLLVLVFASAIPAFARSHVIGQTISPQGSGSAFLARGLQAGHRYQIQVGASTHIKFAGYGTETLTYVVQGHFGTTNKSLAFQGTTPKVFSVRQPSQQGVKSWFLAISLNNAQRSRLKIRLLDLGR